jgi:MFS family permease
MTDQSTEHGAQGSPNTPGQGGVDTGQGLDAAVLKIAAVIVIGAIMSILDVTVVSVALPTFAFEFQTSYANVAWTMTGYTLALATVIPLTGWAADRFGTKRLYILALILFVAGSMLCSVAWDITSLIVFRVLQGFGGGMLMPLGMTILTRAAGPERIGRVMAVLGVPMRSVRSRARSSAGGSSTRRAGTGSS